MATVGAKYKKMHVVYIMACYMQMMSDGWGTSYVELVEFSQ
jgi:hypothetical protein